VFAENARHFVMIDDPAFFHATVEGFLGEALLGEALTPIPSPASGEGGAAPAGNMGER
jgi:hypothetical protein